MQTRDEMRRGLERGEFELHYQPQICLKTNRVVGVEALIRWNHPTRGLLAPADFLDAAEESGLIVALGEWVMREACRQAVQWRREGLSLDVMAINLSSRQFRQGKIEDTVRTVLEETGLDARCLELELTESMLIDDQESVMSAMRNLSSYGIHLSIDDFGTGYSSLSHLKRFKVDRLKIDRSFVRDILTDKEDFGIVKAIIQMAQTLNLKTIAEGVEEAEVASLLTDLGCDGVQGTFYSWALPAQVFAGWISRNGAASGPAVH